ncbi:MAG: 50S ribosomal protein L24 [Candidatus Paceibacterota bacterium]
MKIRKDDNIIVITGKDKGKTGKVTKSLPKENKVIVAGINLRKVHERARNGGQKGQIIDKAMPINVSNVMIVDPKTNKGTRVTLKIENGKKIRMTKKSGAKV